MRFILHRILNIAFYSEILCIQQIVIFAFRISYYIEICNASYSAQCRRAQQSAYCILHCIAGGPSLQLSRAQGEGGPVSHNPPKLDKEKLQQRAHQHLIIKYKYITRKKITAAMSMSSPSRPGSLQQSCAHTSPRPSLLSSPCGTNVLQMYKSNKLRVFALYTV